MISNRLGMFFFQLNDRIFSYFSRNIKVSPFGCWTIKQQVNANVNVNIFNALEFPKEQKCGYLLWSIEATMVQVCFELRLE